MENSYQFFVVRHGERQDKIGKQVANKYDSPLSELGLQQAQMAGEFLKSNVQGPIVVYSSPFYRCLQTANEIAKVLGIERIHINYLASEYMAEKMYDDCPLKNSELVNGQVDFSIVDGDISTAPVYPE